MDSISGAPLSVPAPLRWVATPFGGMLLLAAALLAPGLDQGDLRVDSPVYAWIARHIVISGDWLNLYYDHGQTPYFNKPPLQFWLMALSLQVFGPSLFAVKLVTVLFALATVALLYRLARLWLDPPASATAGVVLVTTYTFLRNCGGCRLDPGVTFFFLLALLAGARMLERPRSQWRDWALLGVAAGLGMLLKSGAALMFVPILVVAFAWQRRWDLLLNPRAIVAVGIAAALVFPWYLHQYATWGSMFLKEHVWRQQVGRLEGGTFGDTAWYGFLRELGLFYWPWLPLVVCGLWLTIRAARSARAPRDRFLLAWTVVAAGILQLIRRKHDRYLMFLFPAFSIFAAMALASWPRLVAFRDPGLRHLGWISLAALLGLTVLPIPLHRTSLPELAVAAPLIAAAKAESGHPLPLVHVRGEIGTNTQCAIRFYTGAEVRRLADDPVTGLQPGDVVAVTRREWAATEGQLPPFALLAEGKSLVFVRVLPRPAARGQP